MALDRGLSGDSTVTEARVPSTPNPTDQDGGVSDLVNQFVAAVDALITSKAVSNISAASKNAPSNKQPPAERASKLEYKLVDET